MCSRPQASQAARNFGMAIVAGSILLVAALIVLL